MNKNSSLVQTGVFLSVFKSLLKIHYSPIAANTLQLHWHCQHSPSTSWPDLHALTVLASSGFEYKCLPYE